MDIVENSRGKPLVISVNTYDIDVLLRALCMLKMRWGTSDNCLERADASHAAELYIMLRGEGSWS